MDGQDEKKAISSPAAIFEKRKLQFTITNSSFL